MVFAQESFKRFFEDHGEKTLAEGAEKKGTLIFTGTLGALRCNVRRLTRYAVDAFCMGVFKLTAYLSILSGRVRILRSISSERQTIGTGARAGDVAKGDSSRAYDREWTYYRRRQR